MVSFVLSFFPRDVLDEILNLIESVSEDFPSYSYASDVFSYSCHDVFYAFSLMQSIEHLTQQFEQMLVVMHSGLYLKHYRRFFPPYAGLSGTLFQRS